MSQPYMSTSHKHGIKAYMCHIKIWHKIYKQWPGNAPRHILPLSIERREVHKKWAKFPEFMCHLLPLF